MVPVLAIIVLMVFVAIVFHGTTDDHPPVQEKGKSWFKHFNDHEDNAPNDQ